MLVVVQFPFTDVRRFSSFHDNLTLKPAWESISSVRGFVRGFGGIRDRYEYLPNPASRKEYKNDKAERHFVDASKHLKLEIRDLPSGYEIEHLYSRLLGDGRLSFRLQFGFSVNLTHQSTIKVRDITKLLSIIAESNLKVRNRTGSMKRYTFLEKDGLFASVNYLRQRIFSKTLLHNSEAEDNSDYLDFSGTNVYIDTTMSKELFADSGEVNSSFDGFGITYLEDFSFESPSGVWIAHGGNHANSDKYRRVRLHILRITAEIRAMEGALRAYRNGLLSEEKLGNFRSVIQSSLDRIAETSRSSSSSLSAIKIAGFTNSQALSDVVDNIRSMCSDTDLFHDKSMEKQFSTLVSGAHNITLINNPQIDGDLISDGGKKMRDSFSNNEGGIIGSGNTVSNSEIKVSWNDMDPNSEIDVKELEKELVKLHAALAEKASEDSEFEETSSVSTALLAAQKDKKSAIMKALGKTGSWVLETAKDIGVPIAVGILTTLAGA